MNIPEVFQRALEAHEESEREFQYCERQHNIERAKILTRELRALGLPVPEGLEFPALTIEEVEFTLTGNRIDGYAARVHVYSQEGDLYWAMVGGLANLGKLLKIHYDISQLVEVEVQ